MPSGSSSVYCQARSNMDFESLDEIFNHTSNLTNKAEKGNYLATISTI
jgi:hypothetical protein